MRTTLAKLDENNIVVNVILGKEELIPRLPDSDKWVVSFETEGEESPEQGAELKYNPASIGMTYDSTNGAFIYKKPFESWTLDSNFRWQAPVPKPSDDLEFGGNLYYTWDEENTAWEVR